MEIPEIEEIQEKIQKSDVTEAEVRKAIERTHVKGRKCIYYKDEVCTAPDCKFKACATCPYGYMYTFAGALKDIFRRVVALAIFFIKSDDVLRDILKVIRGVEIELKEGAMSKRNVNKLEEQVEKIVEKINNPEKRIE